MYFSCDVLFTAIFYDIFADLFIEITIMAAICPQLPLPALEPR
jgi:hypothetical protein